MIPETYTCEACGLEVPVPWFEAVSLYWQRADKAARRLLTECINEAIDEALLAERKEQCTIQKD